MNELNFLNVFKNRNLVYNYNFLNYSNQTSDTIIIYNHPDGWIYNDAGKGGSIGYDPASGSCVLTKSSGNDILTLSQVISEFPRWQLVLANKEISATAIIINPSNDDFTITFSILDGIAVSSKTVRVYGGQELEISLSFLVNSGAKNLTLSISSVTSNASIYVNKVFANVGMSAIEGLPCMVQGIIGERKQYVSTEIPPETELSLCQSTSELSASYTRLNSFLNGKFGYGKNGNSLLPDMRGYFSRAWDNGAGTDPNASSRTALGQQKRVLGDYVGTSQEDMFKSHDHQLLFDLNGKIPAGSSAALPSINNAMTSNTESSGGEETRSKNISELYTIKWA